MRSVYTVGHSTRSAEELIALLGASGLEGVADVRRWPVSSRYPHFSAERLEAALAGVGIAYQQLGATLGGYRTGGYAAYVDTPQFAAGLAALERLATRQRVAVL